MKKILINYADQQYYESQKVNSQSGRRVGGFTDVIEYNKSRLEPEFVSKNADIFKKGRGAGYWLWKPYIILKTLESASSEDLVFYCDAGATFVDSFDDYMFDLCREDDKGLILCNGGHVNKKWTKRDCFVFMDCDTPEYTDTLQLTATFQLCRKTDFTLDFYREHVQLATVKLTLHVIGGGGVSVVKHPSSSNFVVQSTASTVQIVPMYNDSRVGLELRSKDGQRFMLGLGVTSPALDVPANGTNAMSIVLFNGGRA